MGSNLQHRLILTFACALYFSLVFGYTVKEVKIDFSKDFKTFTSDELAKYDGSNPDLPVYMAVKGTVFDVSEGRRFYGPGSPYNALVGKDTSRAVAKMSLEPDDLNNNLDGLSDENLKSLDDIYDGTYAAKYPIAGYMDFLVEAQKTREEL